MRTGVPSQPQQHDEREACTHSHTYAISRRLQVFKNHTIMTLTHSSVRETTQGEVATLSMSELITVHVVDRNRNINKDFLCSRRQVLRHMKYFETHLTVGIAADGTLPDVDISVHCDARVFEWLVNYISETEPRPRITGGSVVSLLVSSEFLQMESLMNECLVYFRDHFRTVMKVPLDISCLSDTLISKLSAITTDQQLITLKDPKDKLLGRLYRLRLQTMVQSSSVRLLCCRACRSLYSNAFRTRLACRGPSDLFKEHEPDSSWTFIGALSQARRALFSWQDIYWWLWAHCTPCQCDVCSKRFPVADIIPSATSDVDVILHCPLCGDMPFRGYILDQKTFKPSDTPWLTSLPEISHALVVNVNITGDIKAAGAIIHSGVLDVGETPSLSVVEDLSKRVPQARPVRSMKPAVPTRAALQSASPARSGQALAGKPVPVAPPVSVSAQMKSLPFSLLSLDDLMSRRGSLRGGAVAAAAQLAAHATGKRSDISKSRQREWRIDQLRSDDEVRMEHLKQVLLSCRWADKRTERVPVSSKITGPVTSFGR